MLILLFILLVVVAPNAWARYVMYLTGYASNPYWSGTLLRRLRQHNVVPEASLVSDITHVALAFMRPTIFNEEQPSSFPFFTSVEKARSKFPSGTAIMVAIGGWGDTAGFEVAAASEGSRKLFAQNVKRMVDITGADGE